MLIIEYYIKCCKNIKFEVNFFLIIKTVFGLIFIILNEIINFFRKSPIGSLLLIFGLWLNCLELP